MLPDLNIGPWRVEVASLLYVLAVLAGGGYYLVRLRRRRFRPGPTARAFLWIVVAGVAGANLGGGLALAWQALAGSPFPVPVKENSILGAMLSGGLAAAVLCRRYRLPFWWAVDQGIPALPLGQAIGRLGCLARGCCGGRPAAAWPGLELPDREGVWAVRYPAQLLAAGADLLILGLLLAVERVFLPPEPPGERRQGGVLARLYLGLYLLKRLGLEYLRADALPPWLGPLNSTQVACAAGLLLVVASLAWQARHRFAGDVEVAQA